MKFSEQIKLIRASKHIHSGWYLNTYPDVAALGLDPATHYLRYGAAMSRNPGKNFQTDFYLNTYLDAAESGINPLLHYVLHGRDKGYVTRAGKNNARKQINMIRTKLLSLGFTDQPLAELRDLLGASPDTQIRAMAARELALWQMRAKNEEGYRTALQFIGLARTEGPPLEFRSKLAIMELLCHYFLNDYDAGRAAYCRGALAGEVTPDLLLARANFESMATGRIAWINEVLKQHAVSPIALLPDNEQPLYDRLTSVVEMPIVTDGPKVTVLIAAYDAAKMLPTALRSLQEQTWKNLEIIVVDDCSPTLDTFRLAEHFAAADPRIRPMRMEQNGGAYMARNRGLSLATGEYITLHDADDWSHPLKIERQVRFMLENPTIIGCTSEQARANDSLEFSRMTQNFSILTSNTSSFLWIREKVLSEIGYWKNVRFGADTDLIRRIEHKWKGSVQRLETGPLSFQRNLSESAVNDEVTASENFAFGVRKELKEICDGFIERQVLHNSLTDQLIIPLRLSPKRQSSMNVRKFDVIITSDFRMQGGSTQSSLQELMAQKVNSIKTGLFSMYRFDFPASRPMENVIREVIDEDGIQLLTYGDVAACDLLIIRYPPILYQSQRFIPKINAKEIKVIVNQPPMSDYGPEGITRYELKDCADNIRRYFGKDATWHPIGPLVREALHTHHSDQLHHINLSDQDWHNIIDINGWDRGKRLRGPKDRLRIGRHSRDHEHKWPDTRADILAAYPDDENVEVHVLGGASTAENILGRIPSNWKVHPFGSFHPRLFLRDIDVWIYFSNPNWIESFGRTIIEAMAVGVPVILPEIYRPLFKDAVLYATPETAVQLAQSLHADSEAYDHHVDKAKAFARDNFSYELHVKRIRG